MVTMNLPKQPLPGLPHMKAHVIRNERCEKCKWKGNMIEPGRFECRAEPPTANSFMVQSRPGAPAQFITHTTYPIIQPDGWCGKWAPRIEGMN
jgi:hypothetical protein